MGFQCSRSNISTYVICKTRAHSRVAKAMKSQIAIRREAVGSQITFRPMCSASFAIYTNCLSAINQSRLGHDQYFSDFEQKTRRLLFKKSVSFKFGNRMQHLLNKIIFFPLFYVILLIQQQDIKCSFLRRSIANFDHFLIV